MEIAKLVLEYLKVLAWPVVAITIAMVFKLQVVELLERLKVSLPGGVLLNFSKEVQGLRQLSDETLPMPPREEKVLASIPLTDANARMITLGLQPSPSGLDMSYYRTLAIQDPNVALAGLRMEVELLARNVANGYKILVPERESGSRLLRRLLQGDAITPSQFELAKTVMRLCNAAVHGTLVSREQAEGVIDSVEVLTGQYLEWLGWHFSDG